MRNLDTAEAKSGGFAAAARLRCHQAAAAKHGKVKGFLPPWVTLDAALTRSAQWVLSFLVLTPGRCRAVGTLRAAGVIKPPREPGEVLEQSKAPGAAAVGQGTQPSRVDGNLALAAEEWSQC